MVIPGTNRRGDIFCSQSDFRIDFCFWLGNFTVTSHDVAKRSFALDACLEVAFTGEIVD